MQVITRHIIPLLLLLSGACSVMAQTGFYVPPAGKIFFSGSVATIYSDVNVQGEMGVGRKALVNFKGRNWENAPTADITDDKGGHGLGGMIRFLTPDTGTKPQSITAGYNAATRTGPAFSNLTIANAAGVSLVSSSMKIRRWLNFSTGTLNVNGNILVVGDNNAGTITGYNDKSFVITPGSSSNGGFLLRERLTSASGMVVFPVGTAAGRYTPAALRYRSSLPDDFYVRVSDSVKALLTGGQDLALWSVNKTWQIGQLQHPGEDIVDITLQHRLDDEGAAFAASRQNAFVSQYTSGGWDAGYPQSSPGPGSLTTGPRLAGSGTNTRSFSSTMSQTSYFTKLAGYNDTARNRTRLWFSAYRTDYQNVYVYWTTNPEIRNKYFVVQRRLITETSFSNRDTLASRAVGGTSFINLDYATNDPNNYTGISYYRLMMVDYNGDSTYSNIVSVGGVPGGLGWTVWPNPTAGHFFVGISRPVAMRELIVWDVLGRVIMRQPVNNRGLIEMYIDTKGAYFIGLIPMDGDHIETKKLIVIGD